MPLNAALIRAYQNGEIYAGNAGATPTLPTDATSVLSTLDFTGIGLLTSDGITETISQDYQDIFAWQANQLVASIPGEFSLSFQFAAMQQDLINVGLWYAGSTITRNATGASIAQKAPSRDLRTWVIHGEDGARLQRIVIPSAQITERGEIVWSSQDVTVWSYTVRAFPDISGNYAYRYLVDPALAL